MTVIRSGKIPYDTEVLLLCGGAGTRLREAVKDRPKPLADINGRPFLDIIIDFFSQQGLKRYLLLAGYMGHIMQEYAARKKMEMRLDISCVIENMPLDTGGAIKHAEPYITSDVFFVANGDTLCQTNLNDFYQYHNKKNAMITMLLNRFSGTEDYGKVHIDENGSVLSFIEKQVTPGKGYANAGVYVMNKSLLTEIPGCTKYSLEKELFPSLVGKSFYGYVIDDPHLDIGTPERYLQANRCL